MRPYPALFFLCLLFSFLQNATAQNLAVNFTIPVVLNVCIADTLSVSVRNLSAQPADDVVVKIAFPNGIMYVSGTISGATEQNVGNLQEPVFSFGTIAAGATSVLQLTLVADCVADKAFDMGALFPFLIDVQSSIGTAQASTGSLLIEKGLILIQSVNDVLMSGERLDTLSRTICVRNTRLAPISEFYFEDEHKMGFQVAIANASNVVQTATNYRSTFGASLISAFGDQDDLFEFNESVCFTEKIAISDCGIPLNNNESVLRVGWGCNGEICSYDSLTNVSISIKESTRVPKLKMIPVWNPPVDYCGNVATTAGIKMINEGRADANNVLITIKVPDPNHVGIVAGSFRLIGSFGTIPIVASLATTHTLANCNQMAASEVNIAVPLVGALDSATLLFDYITCSDVCDQLSPGFSVDFFYKKECPFNGFVSDRVAIEADPGFRLNPSVSLNVNTCFQNGETYNFGYKLISKRLTENQGFINLIFDVPSNLFWSDSCANLLGGTSPVGFTAVQDTSQRTLVTLTYQLPLPSDTVMMPFCLRYGCDSTSVCESDTTLEFTNGQTYYVDPGGLCSNACTVRFPIKTNWVLNQSTPVHCGTTACNEMYLGLSRDACGDDGGGVNPIDTIFPNIDSSARVCWDSRAFRINYGYQDLTDNRIADGTTTAKAQDVALNRFLAYDTMRVEYQVYVDSGSGVRNFFRTVSHRISINDMNVMDNDSFNVQTGQNVFAAADKFRLLYDSVRVKYADGTEYRLRYNGARYINEKKYTRLLQVNTFPTKVLDEYVHIYYLTDIRIDSLFYQGYLPKIDLAQGDSLFVYSDFKLDFNYRPSSNNDPDPPLVGFQTRLTRYCPDQFTYSQKIIHNQYSGYKNTWTSSIFSLKPCVNSSQSKDFNLRFRIARENMFPREVRPLARIADFWQTMPPTAVPVSVKLKYRALQDSVVQQSNVPLPFSQSAGRLNIDFSPAFSEPIDEGFMLGTDVIFGPDCRFGYPDSSKQHLTLTFYTHPDSLVENKFNTLGYFSNLPNLSLQSNDTLVYVTQKNFTIDFNIANSVVSSAPNMWVSALSLSGKATNFNLLQLPPLQPILGTADVFPLGNLGGFAEKKYRLTGLNTSCETDTLLLIYGWDCSPVQALSQNTCGRDTFVILLRKESPELDMKIVQEPIPITLCDTSDYYEITVFNAKRGYAYDLVFSVTLPPGLQIVPGTCQISYPFGSPYVTVNDPNFNGVNYQWAINSIQALIAANGLPGDNFNPQNTENRFGIRFKTIAACGFVGNIQPVFGIKGVDPCGQETNFLNKPGMPVTINGLGQGYGALIKIDQLNPIVEYCGGEQAYICQLTLLGQPTQNDSIFITLPDWTFYIPGSYVAGLNAPAAPFVQSSRQIVVHIPPNLANGSTLKFTFKVGFESGAGCDDQFIMAQSRISTEAFCQTLGLPCNIYVVTAESKCEINVKHPELTISNAGIQFSGNQITATFNINNIGTIPAPAATIQVWNDVNGNGMIEPGTDQLLTTAQQTQGLNPGEVAGLNTNFTGPIDHFCNLIIRLPAAENCLCEDRLLQAPTTNIKYAQQQFCTNQPITVGQPAELGFSYNWLTTNGILCDTCATTTYSPQAPVVPGWPQNLLLEAVSGACKLIYSYEFLFGNVYDVSISNARICKGASVILNVQTTGGAYQWSGPGIVDPGSAQQTVTPDITTVYNLKISFLPGLCTIDTAIVVEVIQGDTIQLDELFTCKGTPIPILNQTTDVAGLYNQEQTNVNGCKDLLQQRLTVYDNVITEEPMQFCLGDTLDVSDTSFTGSGKICRRYQTFNGGCDSMHCVIVTAFDPPNLDNPDTLYGQVLTPIELNGQAGFTSYIWFPAIPDCANCPDATVEFDSAGFYEYVLTVGDGNGCVDTVVYRILIFPPCSAKRVLVPNAFSPNGDQVNDTFKVVDQEGAELIGRMTIYNRWGTKVYESNTQVFWDGMVDQKPAPSDVYVYIIEVLCDGSMEQLVGNVTVLR